ncbi:MAG TPA: alpha/beta hydrolase [Allosphingosinicella sp.]|nr:alpha/beta hydrolase [Allosphingosinicella sp.]
MGRFTASDGTQIAFEDEGAGRPLVLLHGLMAHRGFFERQRALADSFRLVRVDLRGHGDSSSDGATPDLELLADDVERLVAHLGIEGAIGIGWSLGAAVLWRVLAGPASRRFAGAVVVDMTARVMNDGDWQLGLSPAICDARSRAIDEDFGAFAASAGASIFAQPLDAESRKLALWAGEAFARTDRAAVGALWASLVGEDFRPMLAGIRQPTLVVHGTQSHLYGSGTADHLVRALPNARAVAFERSGHAPHLEQPELFNNTLRDFAASLPRLREHQPTP